MLSHLPAAMYGSTAVAITHYFIFPCQKPRGALPVTKERSARLPLLQQRFHPQQLLAIDRESVNTTRIGTFTSDLRTLVI